jgi:hypothetical protein
MSSKLPKGKAAYKAVVKTAKKNAKADHLPSYKGKK